MVIPELRLKPRTPPKSRPQSGEQQPPFVVTADLLKAAENSASQRRQPVAEPEIREKKAAEVNAGKSVENRRKIFGMEDEPDVLHQSTLPVRDIKKASSQSSTDPDKPVANFDLYSKSARGENPTLEPNNASENHSDFPSSLPSVNSQKETSNFPSSKTSDLGSPGSGGEDMSMTLTQSRVSDLEGLTSSR